jgi:hypothetical protein
MWTRSSLSSLIELLNHWTEGVSCHPDIEAERDLGGLLHKEKTMSREDELDDFSLSPDDMDSGQVDASEPALEEPMPEPEPAAPPAPAAPRRRRKRSAKPKRKPAQRAKPKAKAKRKAAKSARKPAARKVAARKKRSTAKKRAKPKK